MIKKVTFLLLFLTAIFSQAQSLLRIEAKTTGEQKISDGSVNLTSSDLEFYDDGGEQIIGLHFENITIPDGAAILEAYIQFTGDEDTGEANTAGSVVVNITGEDIDDSDDLSDTDYNFSDRTARTTAVNWDMPSWSDNTASANERTPDIKGIISELTSRPGWVSGNSITILIDGVSSTGKRRAQSGSGGNTPELIIIIDIQASERIAEGELWKYLDDGSNQGTEWYSAGFDDSSWSNGLAELGYGDGDEETVVSFGGDANNKHRTTYFRKKFSINDKSIYNSINLEAIRDDGMVVYLNGTEIWRDNMPSGIIEFDDLANSPAISGASESTWILNNISSSLLVNGTNVVAVEIHQQADDSSDISFNFKFTPSALPVGAPTVIRGPYLQNGTQNSVVIKWRTNISTDTKVSYGTSLGALNYSVSNVNNVTDHEIELTGLTPNTVHYYQIENSSLIYVPENSEMYVKTPPTPGTKQFVRIWALGDAGTANNDQNNVRDAYYNYVNNLNSPPVAASSHLGQTDMMLFLGDNAYDNGTDTEFQNALFNVYDAVLPKTLMWSTRGNHERNAGVYYDIFAHPTAGEGGGIASGTEEYYSFDYANVHIIVLESYQLENDIADTTGGIDSQLEWLEADIAATTQDWIIAIFHHPPYTKGSHDSDTEQDLIDMRNNFVPALEAGGVDLVLTGHSHSYERSFFINGRLTDNNSHLLDSGNAGAGKTVGSVGDGDGKESGDGAYSRDLLNPSEGAVYVVTGSAGKATSADWSGIGGIHSEITGEHAAMYFSKLVLGSSVIEIEDDGSGGQNLTLKFIRETGAVDDFFTIHKSSSEITLSTETPELDNTLIKMYPVPANSFINVDIKLGEQLEKVKFFNSIGALVKESKKQHINVRNLKAGMYMIVIETDKNNYYKSIIIE